MVSPLESSLPMNWHFLPWTASGRALMWNEPWTQPGLEMWGQVGWLPCLSSQHGWWNGKTNKQIKTLCTCLVPADTCYGGVFYLACKDLGRMFDYSFPACAFFFFKVEISLRTLIPLFRPESVHNGSASWNNCGWIRECSLTSCMWARFRIGFRTMPGQRHSQPTMTLLGKGCMHV